LQVAPAVGSFTDGAIRRERAEYLEQTERHVEMLMTACERLGLDPWLKSLGLKAVLSPPEEEKKVKTAKEQADSAGARRKK
jgi:hypothetical protein